MEHAVLNVCVHGLGVYPAVRWAVLGFTTGWGANPQEFLTWSSGIWALVLLVATLAVTPLRRLTGWSALVRHRRKLGLYSFFYTVLHVLAWALWDRGWSAAAMWADLQQRSFITVGAVAALCLVPLAMTSTRGWMRRLGVGWKKIHRLVYPAAALSILHFDWMRAGKNDFFEPRLYGACVAVLLGLRLWWWWRGRRPPAVRGRPPR